MGFSTTLASVFATSLVAFSLSLLLLVPTDAHACSCRKADVAQSFTSADLVFQGHVAGVAGRWRTDPSSGSSWPVADYLFQVRKVWKGKVAKVVTVSTATQSSACGYPFKVGDTYVVFADKESDSTSAVQRYRTSLCSPNAIESDATAIVAALNSEGKATDPNSVAYKKLSAVEPPKIPTGSGTAPKMPEKPPAPGAKTGTTPPKSPASVTPPSPSGAAGKSEGAPKTACGTCVVGGANGRGGTGSLAVAMLAALALAFRARRSSASRQ